MTFSNNTVRILFGVVAGPLALWLLWMGGWYRTGFLSFLFGAAMWEYARILRVKYPLAGREPETLLPTFAAILVWLSSAGPLAMFGQWRDLTITIAVVWVILHAFRSLERDDAFPWIAKTVGGLLYFGVWGASLLSLCAGRSGGWSSISALIWALGVCWVGDTFAYFFGRAFGKHKLCPQLSPGKSVEGAVAAVVATTAFSVWWAPSYLGLEMLPAAILGILLGVAGILGDLLESVLKRWAGVKDSSKLLPGHGGILDRMDSLFLVAPILQAALVALRR
ncbi:MAG: phosphatidate cytidylyltransferase [Fibrobacterota bacterium]